MEWPVRRNLAADLLVGVQWVGKEHGMCPGAYGLEETGLSNRDTSHLPLGPIHAGGVCVYGSTETMGRVIGFGGSGIFRL